MIGSSSCKGCKKSGNCKIEGQSERNGKTIIGCSDREAEIKLVRTHYDRLVNMMPEDLAKALARFCSECYWCEGMGKADCVECIKIWLDMEVIE